MACFASSSLLATLACVVKPLRAIVQQLPGGLYSTVFRFWWWAAAITASRCPCAFCVGVAFISAATAQRSRVRQRLRPAKRLRPAQAFGGIALCSDSDSALLHSRPIAGVPGGPCAAAAGRARRDRVPKFSRAIATAPRGPCAAAASAITIALDAIALDGHHARMRSAAIVCKAVPVVMASPGPE